MAVHSKYQVKGKYYPTIGIECHVQLKTKTKLFAGVGNDAREAEPNTLITPLCIGMPGTLPVLNAEAVKLTIRAGLALRAEIADVSHFDRKHYFYPDLPKGYQITQFEKPLVGRGVVEVPQDNGDSFTVGITRAHLEEDAGKNTHPTNKDYSLVDLNRSGTPLLEIVSEPDIHSPAEAKAFTRELYLLMKYADVSDVDLYHGNMRFDVNVSVSTDPQKLGTRSETKNLNSFRSVEKAVEFEINRQIELLEKGQPVPQETRGWDEAKQKTIGQRSKEDAHDYRYFPEPDIPPLKITKNMVAEIAKNMPMLPAVLREKFGELGLNTSQINIILEEPVLAEMLRYTNEAHDPKTAKVITNWCLGKLHKLIDDKQATWQKVFENLDHLVKLVSLQDSGLISSTAAKEMLADIIGKNIDPETLAKNKGLLQVSDEGELAIIIEQVLTENAKAVIDVKAGEVKALGFLVGQVMKSSKGRANPALVQKLIKQQLGVGDD
jgi:aspartyl-tRNA(Asn)/glutamyl-tRNA(Gln) amidotransferase subunit B